ncbi:UNVERIFIED_CONTAM: hypothetical protein Scaly_0824300 [Sesamum calycinum]|uniref:Transposase-associated domain-containing protein n=1 Tax=Sesamum calycinum TaxID=2727403 RepID=A0AAW2RA00_9LAMI
MDGDKIRCPCRKCKNTKFGTLDEDYYEAPSAPQVSEEPTPADHVEGNYPQWGDEQHMDWCRGCPVDASFSSYCYDDGDPYDYDELGLADSFSNVVHAADQPLWDGCTQSELGVIAELVVMKADGDYYNTKKLVKNLGLPIEKIYACKNSCMLYWKDDVDLEYCKFCGDPRYKPSRGRDPHRKKSPYVVLRGGFDVSSIRCRVLEAFDRMYPDFIEESRNVRLGLCTDGFAPHASDRYVLGTVDQRAAEVLACGH